MSTDGIEQDTIEPATRQRSQRATGDNERAKRRVDWEAMLGSRKRASGHPSNRTSMSEFDQEAQKKPVKWSMGILNDEETEEVPGSILLLSKVSEYNEPLGLRNAPARTSASSLPSPYLTSSQRSSFSRWRSIIPEKKRTPDGKFILEPQPDDSLNDPLNWKVWRRDCALLSLGFYCMVGGGMTPILAAGFNEVAEDFDVSVPRVALTTGLYMMGLGLGSAILSPTAILYGKRPVYLCSAICFVLTSIWSALSPNFASLVVARICMGVAVSAVECLPSATVAEIFFLHEKAYRLGVYTLLLLGGKNLVPLVSAAIIQSLHWRWVFWIVAMIVGFCFCLLFMFVPETFWDRTPRPHRHLQRLPSRLSLFRTHSILSSPTAMRRSSKPMSENEKVDENLVPETSAERQVSIRHAHFEGDENAGNETTEDDVRSDDKDNKGNDSQKDEVNTEQDQTKAESTHDIKSECDINRASTTAPAYPAAVATRDYTNAAQPALHELDTQSLSSPISRVPTDTENQMPAKSPNPYTEFHRDQPPRSFVEQLKPWNGRLRKESWFRVAARPFILFCYPSILWSTLVYSLSVGWLIVLSESVAAIYQNRHLYNFDSLQTGLVYISPFVGGVLGTAVAGKVSDQVVRFLSRRNGGIYEPEFRLVMGIPIAIFTTIGLMGYGWSAQERDQWIVPTVFFRLLSPLAALSAPPPPSRSPWTLIDSMRAKLWSL